jgi:RecB family exonuclease
MPPVSNSELTLFADCQRRWWFTYVLNLAPRRRDRAVTGALAFGTRIHNCLERKYQNGEVALDVYEELHAEAERALAEVEEAKGVPDMDQRKKLADEHRLGRAMLEGYEQWVTETGIDEGMTFLAAEKLVQVPSGIEGVQLRGKLDQLWRRDIDGALLFRDFKTAADMRSGPASLPRDEQMMFYVLLMRLQHLAKGRGIEDVPRGGMYTMLKKVLRSSRAQPPFYDQHEIMFNDRALRSMYLRTHRRIQQMLGARQALAAGEDHRYVVPPRPSKDCSWKCPFVSVCPMADDTSDESLFPMLNQMYEVVNPYERYGDEQPET